MIVDDRSEQETLAAEVQAIEPTPEQNRMLHRTIREVTQDTQNLEFNTAIARMMEFVNFFTKESKRPKSVMDQFTLLLSPYAPHIGEELWQILGNEDTLAYQPWPTYDEAMIKEDTVEIPVQFGKKVRARIHVPADCSREQLEAAARSNPDVAALLDGKEIIKVIVVPGRLVNFTVK